jgi:glycosyltransferase involved in cell wall biosynthesis
VQFDEQSPVGEFRPELTLVIPTSNSAVVIEKTLAEATHRLADRAAEIIVVENGSTDDTRQILARVCDDWSPAAPALRILTVAKGLGNALHAGIAASRGKTVMITADDLPFGFDELDAAERFGTARSPVVIGSKAHPESEVGRSGLRTILTAGHRFLRWVTLGMRIADPQGTYVLDGDWARSVVGTLRERGFLFTTELAYAAALTGTPVTEVPVRLRQSAHRTRVRVLDVWFMGVGLLAIRRRRGVMIANLGHDQASRSGTRAAGG